MTIPQSISVKTLLPGDRWVSDKDTVLVDHIEMVHGDSPLIRVYGRITRGWGRGNKLRSWTFLPDQLLEIERGA